MQIEFLPVPPPERAPVQEAAKNLGLLPGLWAKETDRQFRCSDCSQMSRDWMVWVPDGVKQGDPDWSVIEAARLNSLNGHHSGWCLECAQKLSGYKPEPVVVPAPSRSLWRRLWPW